MTYQPKAGDRVRVTFEGTVARDVSNTAFRVLTQPDKLVSSSALIRLGEPGVTIEKLADPEPKWVNGDVVEVGDLAYSDGPRTVAHIDGRWVFTDNGETTGPYFMRNNWPRSITVLYKADAQAPAA